MSKRREPRPSPLRGRERPPEVVAKIAAKLRGRKRTPEQRRRIAEGNRGRGPTPTSFKPGHIPWTKGRKGIHLSPATEFKKGTLNGAALKNLKPLGWITVRRDKAGRRRRFIKVRANGPTHLRFIPLARYNYLRHVGPIPAGRFVVHGDGDTMNDAIENLRLMTRKALPAWQRSIDPTIEERRRDRAAKASKMRWRVYRFRQERARERRAWNERVKSVTGNRGQVEEAGDWGPELETGVHYG